MRTGAAAEHVGYFHEAAFYASDEEFLALVVPFFADGLAAGEPVVSAFAAPNQQLIRDAFAGTSGVRYIGGETQYLRPAGAIRCTGSPSTIEKLVRNASCRTRMRSSACLNAARLSSPRIRTPNRM